MRGDADFETAVFGREVEQFCDTDPIGQYLINRAREDLAKAQEALVTIDPYATQEIAALQLNARVAQKVRTWLREAIEAGRNAEALIRQEHGE